MRTVARDERAVLGELDEQECLTLLRWEPIARLAVASPGEAPTVVPINIVVDDRTIVFSTEPGEKWHLLQDQPVSVQADRFDWFRRIGWSVLVRGVAQVVDPSKVKQLEVQAWAPGTKTLYVRIVPTAITGRRIELNQPPLDARGYR